MNDVLLIASIFVQQICTVGSAKLAMETNKRLSHLNTAMFIIFLKVLC